MTAAPAPEAGDAVYAQIQRLLDLGCHLVALRPGTKKAAIGGWKTRPRMGIEEARSYVDRGYGLGIHLGPSGLAVLDSENEAATKALMAAGFEPTVLPAKAQLTPDDPQFAAYAGKRGGVHIWLRVPKGVALRKDSTQIKLPGGGLVDFLAGEGSYVVAPLTSIAESPYPYAAVQGALADPAAALTDPAVVPEWLHSADAEGCPPDLVALLAVGAPKPVVERVWDSAEAQAESQKLSDKIDRIGWDEWGIEDDPRMIFTGETDGCGCVVYKWATADNAKSVTLHANCEMGNGAHVWSGTMRDELGLGGEHLSRLDLSAAMRGVTRAEAASFVGLQLGQRLDYDAAGTAAGDFLEAAAAADAAGDLAAAERNREAARVMQRSADAQREKMLASGRFVEQPLPPEFKVDGAVSFAPAAGTPLPVVDAAGNPVDDVAPAAPAADSQPPLAPVIGIFRERPVEQPAFAPTPPPVAEKPSVPQADAAIARAEEGAALAAELADYLRLVEDPQVELAALMALTRADRSEVVEAAKSGRMIRLGLRAAMLLPGVKNGAYNWQRLREPEVSGDRYVDGGSFIHSIADTTPAVWGSGEEVLWAEGEALIVAGPQGVGKSTLAGNLVDAMISGGEVLGYPVAQRDRILYLAMDRPKQIARALRRQLGGVPEAELAQRLVVWQGPPPEDLAAHPDRLAAMAEKAGADVVIVDSLKDAALGLSSDEVGAGWNRARQTLLAAGVDVLELHHDRKASDVAAPAIEKLYGSVWITSGAGSVIHLGGEPGDPIVRLSHLKQPASEVGPLTVDHDGATGRMTIHAAVDLLEMARRAGGVTASAAAAALFEVEKPTSAQREKARRRLEKLRKDGLVNAAVIASVTVYSAGLTAVHPPTGSAA